MTLGLENAVEKLVISAAEIITSSANIPDGDFEDWFDQQLQVARTAVASSEWESLRNAVRSALRTEHFKPTGRSKPAQEYLLRCLDESPFPRVNRAVDCLNLFSVTQGLPISLLRTDIFVRGVCVRLGRSGESYVFNRAGQSLDLHGLACVCGGEQVDQPYGSPIKDSMSGKIDDSTRNMLVVLYAPASHFCQAKVDDLAQQLSSNITRWHAGTVRLPEATGL